MKDVEALVELIEEAIARRERKLHEEEPPLLPTTSALTSTTAVVGRLLTAVDADVALAAEEDDGADEELADMTELLDADEYLPGDTAAPAAPGGEESRVTLKVATDGGARQRPPTGLARALLSPFPFPRHLPRSQPPGAPRSRARAGGAAESIRARPHRSYRRPTAYYRYQTRSLPCSLLRTRYDVRMCLHPDYGAVPKL